MSTAATPHHRSNFGGRSGASIDVAQCRAYAAAESPASTAVRKSSTGAATASAQALAPSAMTTIAACRNRLERCATKSPSERSAMLAKPLPNLAGGDHSMAPPRFRRNALGDDLVYGDAQAGGAGLDRRAFPEQITGLRERIAGARQARFDDDFVRRRELGAGHAHRIVEREFLWQFAGRDPHRSQRHPWSARGSREDENRVGGRDLFCQRGAHGDASTDRAGVAFAGRRRRPRRLFFNDTATTE